MFFYILVFHTNVSWVEYVNATPSTHCFHRKIFTLSQCISIIVQKISREKFNSNSVLVRDLKEAAYFGISNSAKIVTANTAAPVRVPFRIQA